MLRRAEPTSRRVLTPGMRRASRWLGVVLSALAGCEGNLTLPAGPGEGQPGEADSHDGHADGCAEASADCRAPAAPTRAPLRRLTRFEYNNTVRDLFGDDTQPASMLPTEPIGNGFGNDADALSVSSLLAEQYGLVAEQVAERATASPEVLARLAPCAGSVDEASAAACTRTLIEALAPRVYRRPLQEGEAEALEALATEVRQTQDATFATGISAVIQALLQSPEFLYRLEFGQPDPQSPGLRRPRGHEMATRLSYLFWGTLPDDALREAAESGALSTNEGVREQAARLLDDERSHAVVRFFFDNLLPINGLSDLTRDPALYPAYSHALGAAMREETQRFLEYEIFEAGGSWRSALTAPYTFVNEALADFYGIDGVSGEQFRKVDWPDPSQRLGLLLQAGVMAGTITTNHSNPVLRGSFIINKLMCAHITLPTDPDILAQVKVPEDTSGATARERFSKHSEQAICATCHRTLDPVGFALENFDAVGQYRERENGVLIDASGSVPGMAGEVSGPVELVKKIAESESTHACFASHWMNFAYGRTLGAEEQATQQAVVAAFRASNYNIKELLLALTQTDAFLYLPEEVAP